jgi:hypothetical protein
LKGVVGRGSETEVGVEEEVEPRFEAAKAPLVDEGKVKVDIVFDKLDFGGGGGASSVVVVLLLVLVFQPETDLEPELEATLPLLLLKSTLACISPTKPGTDLVAPGPVTDLAIPFAVLVTVLKGSHIL